MMSDAEQTSKHRAKSFVDSACRIISAMLENQFELSKKEAVELARNMVHDLCVEYGGTFMYVPKDMHYELSQRDMEIFNEFNGRNLHQLVKKHGVTHTRIYQIVAQVKKAQIELRQGRLPGFDSDPEPT